MASLKKTNDWYILICIFEVGAIMGWIYEVLLHIVQKGELVNRGMLHGPWLPIYGIGAILMYILFKEYKSKPMTLFMISIMASGILEYVSSWLLETIYHTRWWDYSKCAFNVNGRIFLAGLLAFGIAGTIFAYVFIPRIQRLVEKRLYWQKVFVMVIALVMGVDLLISLIIPNMGTGVSVKSFL